MLEDTIFALATARGRGGVAVVRISGPLAHWAVSQFCAVPEPRVARVRWLVVDGERVDQALVLVFSESASFTGEACAELHLHGSVAVVSKMLDALGALPGLRLAKAGEFTRRAMENGKLDLAQVEGLADLIDAETEVQRRRAVAVLGGALGRLVEGWRADLVHALALIEAMIDFADEDIPDGLLPEVLALVGGVAKQVQAELDGSDIAEAVRDGFEVAIVGAPNAGKSTLLNAIARRDVALTSEMAGTTRDVIEVRMNIGGYAVTLLDTAGLHESRDVVERMGIERGMARARAADLRVFLLSQVGEALPLGVVEGDIVVLGKGDVRSVGVQSVSGRTRLGIDALLGQIAQELDRRSASAGLFTRARHKESLRAAIVALTPVTGMGRAGVELMAFHLREALQALEVLLGRVGVEDVLADIYSRFCVGK